VRGAVDIDPILRLALQPRNLVPHLVVQNFGAAAGDAVEASIAQTADGGAQVELAVLGDSQDLAGAQAVQPDGREALLDAGEEALEPVDLEVRVDAALHQHAGSAHIERLADLVVDGVEVEDVALGGELALERPVEGAEGTVLGAEVGVVDVAVDDVADHALGMKAAAHGVCLHADADQVVGGEAIERLLAGDTHAVSLRLPGERQKRERDVSAMYAMDLLMGLHCQRARGVARIADEVRDADAAIAVAQQGEVADVRDLFVELGRTVEVSDLVLRQTAWPAADLCM
jgi:hypothetical protein